MKKAVSNLLFFGACGVAGLALGVGVAETKRTITETIVGHVVRPQQLEPTLARVQNLKAPSGFRITKWAEMQNPRMIAVAPEGTVYISEREPGRLVMLRDTNNDGRADVQKVVAQKPMLHGVTVRGNELYFVTVKEVFVAKRNADGTLQEPRKIINDLPDGGQHPNRTLAFGPDGMLYITVGSTCNACDETDEESATIVRVPPSGKNRKIYATGLRNTIGFGWHPVSKLMVGADHGIDWLGDNEQREELNILLAGKRYGWPYIYENDKYNPADSPPAGYTWASWAAMSQSPMTTYTAHSAPMQMAFNTGSHFPAEYKNDAFIAMRGSWNRQPPSGYEVVRVRFDQRGLPTKMEPFLTGFLLPNGAPGDKPGHIGRLAGLAMLKDGSMLLGDDTNGIVYRISYNETKRPLTSALDSRQLAKQVQETRNAPMSLTVKANAFRNRGTIPLEYSAYGKNRSPIIRWSSPPRGTKSFVVMMEDPDATSPKPFVHWLVANIPSGTRSLPYNVPKGEKPAALMGAMQGSGTTSITGYFGPKPPAGPPHDYHFQVFALDTKLDLKSGFNRQALIDAMKGHVLAKGEVVGRFKR